MAARSYGQYCGVTRALELVGDRWALLIVRDLLVGPRRYGDLRAGLPRIPTNILATRLSELVDAGLARKVVVKRLGTLYELTDHGLALEPVVLALGRFGFRTLGEPGDGEIVTSDSLSMALRTAFRGDAAARVAPFVVDLHVGDVALRASVAGARLDVATVELERPEAAEQGVVARALRARRPDLVLAAGPGIRHVLSGERTPVEAIAAGDLELLAGDASLLGAFADVFHIDATSAEAAALAERCT